VRISYKYGSTQTSGVTLSTYFGDGETIISVGHTRELTAVQVRSVHKMSGLREDGRACVAS
jgi:hypothetical protein